MKTIQNKFKCYSGLWNKMTEAQKKTYNSIRAHKVGFVAHPKMNIPKEQFETLSHNFAWLASQEIKY